MGPIVVALGGNAISPDGEIDTIENQFMHTMATARKLVHLVQLGWERIVITHGNGPQVGNIVTRVEMAKDVAPWLPLYICVADTQGGMGYMIQQCLQNALAEAGQAASVVSVVTQVVVDADDAAFGNPTKPIGPQKKLVASPVPQRIVERSAIDALLAAGAIVIAAGGGGVPVVETGDGLMGVDAVIDKDMTASMMARSIGATTFVILTDVAGVMVQGEVLRKVSASRLRGLADPDVFPAGSMGPKVEAALGFVEAGGEVAIIAHLDDLETALAGGAGTMVIGDPGSTV